METLLPGEADAAAQDLHFEKTDEKNRADSGWSPDSNERQGTVKTVNLCLIGGPEGEEVESGGSQCLSVHGVRMSSNSWKTSPHV